MKIDRTTLSTGRPDGPLFHMECRWPGASESERQASGKLSTARFESVYPISHEDTKALPVKELGAAIAFYETVLGFSVVSRDSSTAVLARNEVRIGLIREANHEARKAGSLAFAVDDLEAMRHELQSSGGSPGEFGIDECGGKRYRTFFLREGENGYCYCFYCPLEADRS